MGSNQSTADDVPTMTEKECRTSGGFVAGWVLFAICCCIAFCLMLPIILYLGLMKEKSGF